MCNAVTWTPNRDNHCYKKTICQNALPVSEIVANAPDMAGAISAILEVENVCPTYAWETDNLGVCQPKQQHFTLQCNDNGMKVELSKALLPEAKEVFLQDSSCVATYDSANEKWLIDTALDACSTSLTKNADGTLAFSNKLQINAFRKEIIKSY